jgi:ribosomal protein S27E
MKRVKKSIPKVKIETIQRECYEIQCPHCKTFFQGGYNRQSLRIACSRCANPIEIEWDKAIKVTHF